MADAYRVQINLPILRQHLAGAGDEFTPDQLKSWLKDSGFKVQPDGTFLCEEDDLGLLDKSEIISKRRL